jgi:hypothetical protein
MKSFKEAIETGDQPDLIHPEKRKQLEAGTEEILGVLPEKAQNYYEMIVSEAYQKLLSRIQHYTKAPVTQQNFPQLVAKMFAAFNKISEVESVNKVKLEKMAVQVVLDLPEFEFIKNLVERNRLKIVAKLGTPDLKNAVTQSEQEAQDKMLPDAEGLSDLEELNQIVAENLFDDTETKLRRRLANTLMQGNAVSKLYLFNLVKNQLDEMDKSLIYNYGLVTTVVQLFYFVSPPIENFTLSMIETAAQGSEEVVPEGDIYTIRALAKTFPYLVHEVVKGIYEYLAIDPDKSVPEAQVERKLKKDVIEQEVTDTIAGPELWNKIFELIGTEDQKYLPFVYQSVLSMPIEDIKKIFKGENEGERLVQGLVMRAKKTASQAEQD